MSRIAMSPWSRDAMDPVALAVLEERARTLGVRVSTVKSSRKGTWTVRAFSGPLRVAITGRGALEAVIAGALDDWEVLAMADEDDAPPPDINREGLPEFNGAFR